MARLNNLAGLLRLSGQIFPIPDLLGNHFTWISYISLLISYGQRETGSFFSRIFTKEFCIVNNHGRYCVSSRGRQVCLSGLLKIMFPPDLQKLCRFAWILYKRFRYPKLGVPRLWCNPRCVQAPTWATLHCSHGTWGGQVELTRIWSLCPCTVSVKLFDCDPGVSCLLPGSMKCWQANWFVSTGKSQTLHCSWQCPYHRLRTIHLM